MFSPPAPIKSRENLKKIIGKSSENQEKHRKNTRRSEEKRMIMSMIVPLIRKIIGKTHCLVDGSLNVTYSLTQHDIGNIRFILVPVYNDFSSGQISISNELLVHSVE
jgi:hypothetical protein